MTSLLPLFHIKIRGGPDPTHPGPYSPPPTPDGGYSKSTDVYYWHKLCKTSASRLFRIFLNIPPAPTAPPTPDGGFSLKWLGPSP